MVEQKANITIPVAVSTSIEIKILISWQEVDRLLQEREFAAAFLVAAINVEATLRDHISQFSLPRIPLFFCKYPRLARLLWLADCRVLSNYKNIEDRYLGTCFEVAKYLAKNYAFSLIGDWKNQIGPLVNPRNKIAHQRGYFERFNQLKEMNENELQSIINMSREFCTANPITRK